MVAEPLLCGIDAGTSQTRALLFTLQGRIVAHAAEPASVHAPAPGQGEIDADGLWRTVVGLLRRVTAQVPDPRAIRGLAIASVGEAGVLLDERGAALGPIIAWYDTRTTDELEQRLELVGVDRLPQITGLCPDPTFSLLKLLWLRRHRAEQFAAARSWLNVADFLAWRLSGERATNHSLASRSLLLDVEDRVWSGQILAATGISARLLAPLLASGTCLGQILPEIAAATSLPPDLVVGVGGHDHVCGMLAAGADRPGLPLDSIGTAEALTFVRAAPVAEPGLGWDGFNQGILEVDRPLAYVFGGLPTAAAAVEWFRGLHGFDHAQLIAEAAAEPPGCDGVLFLPHLRLGSPPFPDPVGRGAFLGLSASTRRGTLFRAVLEGIALDAGNMLRAMLRHLGEPPPERIVAIGGSTRNHLLMQMKASVYGVPLAVLDLPDTTCLGAALLGGIAAGLFPGMEEARAGLEVGVKLVEPLPDWEPERRRERQLDYAAAYAALRPVHARLLNR